MPKSPGDASVLDGQIERARAGASTRRSAACLPAKHAPTPSHGTTTTAMPGSATALYSINAVLGAGAGRTAASSGASQAVFELEQRVLMLMTRLAWWRCCAGRQGWSASKNRPHRGDAIRTPNSTRTAVSRWVADDGLWGASAAHATALYLLQLDQLTSRRLVVVQSHTNGIFCRTWCISGAGLPGGRITASGSGVTRANHGERSATPARSPGQRRPWRPSMGFDPLMAPTAKRLAAVTAHPPSRR